MGSKCTAWSLLLLLCLFSSSALAQQQNTTNTPVTTTTSNATDAKGLEGAALAAAIDENSEAQEFKEETIPVSAQVIKGEKAAVLNAGTGDVSTTGACEQDVDSFCTDVAPGLGGLSKCLTDQLAEEAKPDYKGKKVTDKCKAELEQFKQERAESINKDVPLAEACAKDAEKLCKNLPSGSSLLSCLRSKKEQLTEACSAEVFQRQTDAADDWRTDVELHKACKVDAESLCKGTGSNGGEMQECLAKHRSLLSWECQEQLFRQEVENSEDVRLSVRLFRSCLADKKKFCPDVQPGNARAKECLEENRDKPEFSDACKAEVEKMMEARAADFRLDPKLRKLCQEDIHMVCGYEKDSLDSVAGEDAVVIQCLQDYRDEIESPACQARVHKIMEYASSDIRFDVPLADACYEDREAFCTNVAPGSARVIRCLQDRRQDLSYECKATLFDQEVRMAESIDFQYPMKKSCGEAIKLFCKDVPHGHARVMRCLQEHLDDAKMPPPCKAEVGNSTARSAQDYRLNYRLSEACHDTIASKCADSCSSVSIEQPCGGTVLRCLTEKLEEIDNAECKKEVFYFVKMEVRDFRNDVILAEACRTDVDKHCKNVERGEGRVHACLREHRTELTERCRAEEVKLAIMEASNTELMPSLARACKAERAAHCKAVRPGKARVFSCLLQHSDEGDYSPECTKQITGQQTRRVKDWRLDYDLRNACKDDVNSVCKDATADEDRDNGAVFKCLVAKSGETSEKCQSQVVRSVGNALQFYAPAMPVTDVCDADVAAKCDGRSGVGAVRKCLAESLPKATVPQVTAEKTVVRRLLPEADAAATLNPAVAAAAASRTAASSGSQAGTLSKPCEALVALANPQDDYAIFASSWQATGIATQARFLEQKFGLSAGTLTPKSAQDGVLTLTGWTAVLGCLALLVVAIAGGIMGYRRYKGWDQLKGYTMVLKEPIRPRNASPGPAS